MAIFSPLLERMFLVKVTKRGWLELMASSGMNNDLDAEESGFGRAPGVVNSPHPSLTTISEVIR